eukprot:CAMPEP_0119333712 /NCGR_PEP_ID=MMETSP1333-20130426/85803_1 /TAXON_ID=418940 /ORGANISM="Scyphosphaera apsteinii, Strain RCC1455" /LENGTH=178 /DNA_ID=CAMNT_0007343845 /DNA_START=1 /DNA_END=534 /DNA_ORIENTATION=-
MFLYEDKQLNPLTDERWYYDSIHVFKGDFTCAEDKPKLVDTVIGLWTHALKHHDTSEQVKVVYDLIIANKASVFPQAYFGDLIELLEDNIQSFGTSALTKTDRQVPSTPTSAAAVVQLPHELLHLNKLDDHSWRSLSEVVMEGKMNVFTLHTLVTSAKLHRSPSIVSESSIDRLSPDW